MIQCLPRVGGGSHFWTRSSSHVATHLVLILVLVEATLFRNQIGNEICQDCSSSKYALIDGIGFFCWPPSTCGVVGSAVCATVPDP